MLDREASQDYSTIVGGSIEPARHIRPVCGDHRESGAGDTRPGRGCALNQAGDLNHRGRGGFGAADAAQTDYCFFARGAPRSNGRAFNSTTSSVLSRRDDKMRQSSWICTAASLAALLFGLGDTASAQVTFDWATVGNPGNAADPLNEGSIPGIGSVAYEYRIAKHEVTNDQYAAFLNAVAATDTNGLYSVFMGSNTHVGITQNGVSGSFTYSVKADMGDKPVIFVSFFDAMRFVNWLHNGQPAGAQDASTTQDGVYAISDGLSETGAPPSEHKLSVESRSLISNTERSTVRTWGTWDISVPRR